MQNRNNIIFSIFNYTLFTLLSLAMLYPFWYTLMGSMMESKEYLGTIIFLFPHKPTFEAYRLIFNSGLITSPMCVTILITVVGTFFSLFITSYTAYGLSKKFVGSSIIMYFIVFTMFFHGGLIPTYIIYRKMNLINNMLVYLLPMSINTFNLIIMRTSFAGFSSEIEEASVIDGCNEFGTFFRIVLPLSKPLLATIGLFFAVSYWNTFFASLFYVNDVKMKTLQDYLYRIIAVSTPEDMGMYETKKVFIESVKLANIIIVITPIILVYPFLQKYFVKGIMIGAVKG